MNFDAPFFSSIYWIVGWRVLVFTLLTWFLLKMFRSFGTKAKSIDISNRWSNTIKPSVGGFVFLGGFLLGLMQLTNEEYLGINFAFLLSAGLVAFGLGLWDDLQRISASKKFLGQVFVALLFVFADDRIQLFPRGQEHVMIFQIVTLVVIVLAVVATMNSVNMLDNMDGIATIATMPCMLLPLIGFCFPDLLMGISMLTALIGFLVFNWTPAKVYMGDAGSMLLGLITAWMVLSTNNNVGFPSDVNRVLTLVILFMGAGSLFIVDSIVVVVNRTRHGVSPFKGGRDHTTHNLFYLGMKQWQIGLLFLLLAALQLFLTSEFIDNLKHNNTSDLLSLSSPILAYFFLLLMTHLLISFRNLRKGKYSYSS